VLRPRPGGAAHAVDAREWLSKLELVAQLGAAHERQRELEWRLGRAEHRMRSMVRPSHA
jgi:hypothetical protein